MKGVLTLFLYFLFGATLQFSQTSAEDELLQKANENFELLATNPKQAFKEAKKIEKKASDTNANEAQLKSIDTQCVYYRKNNDFENLTSASKLLFQKGTSIF